MENRTNLVEPPPPAREKLKATSPKVAPRSSKRRWIIVGGAALFLLFLWWGCHHNSGETSATSRGGGHAGAGPHGSGGPVPVVPGKVEQKDVPIYLEGLGTVQAFNTVTVHSRVDGQIEKILFTEGQDVKAGDLLAQIDPRPYQAALDQAIGKKGQDEAQLANAQASLARNTELLKKQVIDQQDFDTAKAGAGQYQAAVQADQAAIEAAQVQLDYTQIKSPIDGRTGIRMVDVGNVIHATDTNGIVVITQLKPISVVFTLPEQNLQELLKQGGEASDLPVTALDRANTGAIAQGKLAVINNQIDQSTGTVSLKATFPNDDLKLWPGEFVNARLVLEVEKNATVVPANVVQRGPQGTYAYLIKADKTVALQPVKVGPTEDNQTVIESGLKPGDQVVVDGQYKLQPGSHVELTSGAANSSSTKSAALPGGSPGSRSHKRTKP